MHRILFALTLASSLLASPAVLSFLERETLSKEGCGWDPWGRCNPAPPPLPATDAGCGWDPWGCSQGS